MGSNLYRSTGELKINKLAKMNVDTSWEPVAECDFVLLHYDNERFNGRMSGSNRFGGNAKHILPILPQLNAWASGNAWVIVRRPGNDTKRFFFFGFGFDNEADAVQFRLLIDAVPFRLNAASWYETLRNLL